MNNIEIKGNTTQKEDVDPEKPKEIKNEVILSVIDNDGKQKQIPIDIAFNGLKEGEYFFKENDKWYLHKLEDRTERIKMMNNIEILEELINGAKEFNQYNGNKYYKAIENLIKENKELKEENKVAKKMGAEIMADFIKKDIIPKSKLKEIVELYDNTLQCTRKYNQDLADILCDLEELLEKGE